MVIRGSLYVFAILILLVGVSQLIFPFWWMNQALSLVNSSWLYVFAVIGIVMGFLLIIAAKRRLIGLRTFMYILGSIVVVFGIVFIANPGSAYDMTKALFVDHSRNYMIGMMMLSGVIRTGLGIIIIYALSRPPASESI